MASFQNFEPTLKQLEGGYQNISSDSGNYNSEGLLVGTNFGISAKVLEDWLNRPITADDMKNLSWSTAQQIHKYWYWDEMKASNYNDQAVAELVVDHAINAGVGKASILLQMVLNTFFEKSLDIDGQVGDLTLAALNSVNQSDLFSFYAEARKADYESKNKPQFLSIWLDRIATITNKFGISLEKSKNTLIIVGAMLAFATLAYLLIKNPTTERA